MNWMIVAALVLSCLNSVLVFELLRRVGDAEEELREAERSIARAHAEGLERRHQLRRLGEALGYEPYETHSCGWRAKTAKPVL